MRRDLYTDTNPMRKVSFPGFQLAIEALQSLDQKTQDRILLQISQTKPDLALKLKNGLFQFTDLEFILDSDFKMIWWDIPRQTWLIALRKASTGIMKMLEKKLTGRAWKELSQQLKEQQPQRLSLVLLSQKEICDRIRELADQGRMALPKKNNEKMVP